MQLLLHTPVRELKMYMLHGIFFKDKSKFIFLLLLKHGHIWSNAAARINFIVISNRYIKIYKFLFKNLAIKKKYLPVALLISNF